MDKNLIIYSQDDVPSLIEDAVYNSGLECVVSSRLCHLASFMSEDVAVNGVLLFSSLKSHSGDHQELYPVCI